MPSEAMSAPEFRHGSVEVLDGSHVLVVFATDVPAGHDVWAYVAEFLAMGALVVTIGALPPATFANPQLVAIEVDHEASPLAALAEIVPVQLLVAAIAKEEGFETGHFRNTTPVVSEMPVRTTAA
jgi:fructoselysine-6-P-deglycase FrlB-like protein